MESTHFQRKYKENFNKFSRETAIYIQDLAYVVENIRRDTEPIDLEGYCYRDPLHFFNDKYGHYFTDEVLSKLQQTLLHYCQLQRTQQQENVLDLISKLDAEGSTSFEYLLRFSAFVIDNFPAIFALCIFGLLRVGETYNNWIDRLNHSRYIATKNHGKPYEIWFYRYPAPAYVFRYLHAACKSWSWNCLPNYGYHGEDQAQCALVSYHELSLPSSFFFNFL